MSGNGGMGGRPSRLRRSRARVGALMDLATWISTHFKLAQQPKIHTATQAEVVYAHILGMLHDESLEQQELASVPPGPINVPDVVYGAAIAASLAKAKELGVLTSSVTSRDTEIMRATVEAAIERWILLERGSDGDKGGRLRSNGELPESVDQVGEPGGGSARS